MINLIPEFDGFASYVNYVVDYFVSTEITVAMSAENLALAFKIFR
jgi:hypothetical protein